jgi:hypothetical protein
MADTRIIAQKPRKFTGRGYAISAPLHRKCILSAGFGEVPGCLSPTGGRLANGNSRS